MNAVIGRRPGRSAGKDDVAKFSAGIYEKRLRVRRGANAGRYRSGLYLRKGEDDEDLRTIAECGPRRGNPGAHRPLDRNVILGGVVFREVDKDVVQVVAERLHVALVEMVPRGRECGISAGAGANPSLAPDSYLAVFTVEAIRDEEWP